MGVDHTFESKVMAVWICREHSCSISRVSIYYAPESDIRVKSYSHFNFWELLLFNFERLDISWASIIHSSQKLWPFEYAESFCGQFQGSRYMMHVNRTSEWKVIAIWISRELPLFNFERHDISLASIIHSSQKLRPFEFSESFRGQFPGSRYMMPVNQTSEWKVIAIWISQELPLSNFEHLDISWASIINSSQKLWPFEFAESFRGQFWGSRYMIHVNRTSELKVIAI